MLHKTIQPGIPIPLPSIRSSRLRHCCRREFPIDCEILHTAWLCCPTAWPAHSPHMLTMTCTAGKGGSMVRRSSGRRASRHRSLIAVRASLRRGALRCWLPPGQRRSTRASAQDLPSENMSRALDGRPIRAGSYGPHDHTSATLRSGEAGLEQYRAGPLKMDGHDAGSLTTVGRDSDRHGLVGDAGILGGEPDVGRVCDGKTDGAATS